MWVITWIVILVATLVIGNKNRKVNLYDQLKAGEISEEEFLKKI